MEPTVSFKDKVATLENYLRTSTGLTLVHDINFDQMRVRFCFARGSPPKSWKHILEVANDEIENHEADDTIKRLEAAEWLRHLSGNPGKIFIFEDGKLAVGGDCS